MYCIYVDIFHYPPNEDIFYDIYGFPNIRVVFKVTLSKELISYMDLQIQLKDNLVKSSYNLVSDMFTQ